MTTAPDYLALRLVCLKGLEEWTNARDMLSFLRINEGAARFVSGPASRSLSPGDVLVASSAFQGKLVSSSEHDLFFSVFFVSVEHLFPLFATQEIALLQSVMDCFKPFKQYPAATSVAQRWVRFLEEAPAQAGLDQRAQLLRAVAAVLAAEFGALQRQRVAAGGVEGHVIRIFEQLPVKDLLELPVGELAAKFNCSRRHLNRLFHQYFGFSVGALKMEMRLLKAVSLLREPGVKIINVAEQCGFNHLGLFNTCFKKRFGNSPGDWRKSKLSGESPIGDPAAANNGCYQKLNGLCPWACGASHSMARKASEIFDSQPPLARDPRARI